MEAIGSFLGTIFGPIGQVFHYVFYEPVYNVLMLLYQAVNTFFPAGAFALAIILLTLIIRAALIPLTRKQLQSTRKMQMLQPQLKELQARYKNDPQALMREQQALYKHHGASMYGGCLPLLVQMPFLYALYYSFFGVLQTHTVTVGGVTRPETVAEHVARINQDIYPFLPHLSALPHMQFFWTTLATPDTLHILPIVAGILTFIQLRMAMPVRKPTPPGQNPDPTSQATQMTQYIMPFVTIFIGWTFPAGLALYWTVSTGFSAVQQYFINGNWGSLFVGIPGMEHLVPEAKDLTPTVTRTATPASGSARAAVPTQEAPPTGGGLRGMWRQLRESAAAAQTVAAEEVEKRQQAREQVDSTRSSGGATAPTRERRQRPSKQGPILVKPPSSTPAADALSESPSDAIAATAKSQELPEQTVARGANGATSGTASGTANGAKPANLTQRPGSNGGSRANTPGGSGAGQRRSGGKGASGSRQRGGRPKGSR